MKKKKKIHPLDLDKETIAKLDKQQLEALAGGSNDLEPECGHTCILISRIIKPEV